MIGGFIAAAMAASFFIPWVHFFGDSVSPYSALSGQFGEVPWGDAPWQVWAFLASGALAAIVALRAFVGQATGGLMLITGLIPFALIGHAAVTSDGAVADSIDQVSQVPGVDSGNFSEAWQVIQDFVGLGGPMYFVAALLLVIIGGVRMARGA